MAIFNNFPKLALSGGISLKSIIIVIYYGVKLLLNQMPFGKNNFRLKNGLGWEIFSVSVALLLSAVAILLLLSNWRIFKKTLASIDQRKLAEANVSTLSKREADLEAKVNELQTEAGIEKEIRERFSVVWPGEEVIMIVEGKNAFSAEINENIEQSWWQRFVEWIRE